MAGNGYSVDDILEEVRRKKQKEAAAGAPTEKQGDFFEMRQKNTVPEKKQEQAPTYTKKYNSEPMTTRTIQVDDTLSQYFGPTEWKNGKKPKEKKDGFAAKVNTVPAHETTVVPVSKNEDKPEGFVPKDMSKHFAERDFDRPVNGFAKTAVAPEKAPEAQKQEHLEKAKEAEHFEKTEQTEEKQTAAPEEKFSAGIVGGFAAAKEKKESGENDLTDSSNRDLYKEFTEKRRDKVEEFMKQVAEPTHQGIHIPEVPSREPVKNKFSEKANTDIAKDLVEGMHQPEDDDPDDYENPSQAESVEKNLSNQFTSLIIRCIIILVLFVCASVLCLSPVLGYQLPEAIAFSKSGIVFPAINLAIICIAALTCNVTVGGGLLSLARFRAGNDTFAACSVIGAAALGVSFVIDPTSMSSGGENLFFPITLLCLLFNTIGKALSAKRIGDNFETLVSGKDQSALLPVHNKELARELTGQRDETPRFCTSAKAKFFARFLELSYRDDATESIARVVAPIVFLCSILVGVIAFLLTGRISDAVTGFAAILCVASPFSATIAGALPVYRSCRALNERGSMMAGGYTAETFAETDSVLLDIEDLFPAGSIVLHAIKTFAQGRIDEAILDAASVICSTKSTLCRYFLMLCRATESCSVR